MTYSRTLSAITCGNSAAPNGWTSRPNGALELIASADDTDFAEDTSNNSGTSSVDQGYLLDNKPTDFVTMASVSVRLRYGWAAAFTNRTWDSLSARIMNGTQVLAGSTSGGGFQTVVGTAITTTTPVNSAVTAFTYVNTAATKTDWDAAVLEMRITSTRSGGGSSIGRRVYAAEITGTYNAYRPELKYYNGSTWIWKPLFVYVGGQWVYKTLKRWDGTQWVREPD